MKYGVAVATTGLRNGKYAQEFAFICAGIPIVPDTRRRAVHPYFKRVHTFLKFPFLLCFIAQFSLKRMQSRGQKSQT
jgi:hypothetical protein